VTAALWTVVEKNASKRRLLELHFCSFQTLAFLWTVI